MSATLNNITHRGDLRLRSAARTSAINHALWFVAFEAAFFVAYRYGMSFSQVTASPFWFPDAILLCALLKSRPRNWWIFVLGSLPIRLFSDVSQGIPEWFLSGSFALDSAKALAAAFFLRRYIRNPLRPETVRDFLVFMAITMFWVPGAVAFAGAALRSYRGFDYWMSWQQWFLGDILAQLVVTPFILYWIFDIPWKHWRRRLRDRVEAALLLIALIVTGYFAANTDSGSISFADARFYLPVPFLFWAAIRFGVSGAAGAIVIVSIFAVEAVIVGHGPFAGLSPRDTALALQNFLLLRSAPLYLVAVSLEQARSALRAARESEDRFRKMAHDAPVLIWMSRTDMLCNFFNQVWLDFTGRTFEQEFGAGWADGVHSDDLKYCLECYQASFDARRPFEMEYRLRRHDGEYRWLLDKGVPRYTSNGEFIGYIGTAVDITDLKRLDETNRALAHAQRLAVMGELTAAIAHEVRQPLTAISLNAEALCKSVNFENPPLQEMRAMASDISDNVLRADAVISRLRAFMRKHDAEILPIDLNTVVSDVLWLVSGDITRRGIQVQTELDRSLPLVLGDRTQLQQVLLNLVVNSMEAMNDLPDTERHLLFRVRQADGDYMEVIISDCGCGIPMDSQPLLFESFFTTRKDGMGLGLSIARSILKAHRGKIWAQNNEDGGAAFHFTVPIAKRAVVHEIAPS